MDYYWLMKYNWQQPDWPHFVYSEEVIQDEIVAVAEKIGLQKGLVRGLSADAQMEILIEILADEALKTSEIEDEFLKRSDVKSSIRKNLGLEVPPGMVKDARARGIAELMVKVRNSYAEPLSEQMLFTWHEALFLNNTRLQVGAWRIGTAPMQVVSGRWDRPTVHFEAPPSGQVPEEMACFIDWFNESAPEGGRPIKYAAVRSAMAHLYFESIHPFEDGNGRMGRAIADKALSQSVGYPLMLSLSTILEKNKASYYKALESGQLSNEITEWVSYFVRMISDAHDYSTSIIEFTLQKARFFSQYESLFNGRQLKVINRMLEEGPAGFEGGMTARKYIAITGASKATATRDLQELESWGVLEVSGRGRSTRYGLVLG